MNGDPDRRAEIVSTRGGLEARNEHGDSSRLTVERDGNIPRSIGKAVFAATSAEIESIGRTAPRGHVNHLAVSPHQIDKARSNALARSWFQRSIENRVLMSLSAVSARVARISASLMRLDKASAKALVTVGSVRKSGW